MRGNSVATSKRLIAAQPASRRAWLGRLLLVALGLALSGTTTGGSAKAQVSHTPKESSTCPSKDFITFFRAFSTMKHLQRTYTQLPLEYGVLDLVGTAENPEPSFKKRRIRKYEEIPQYRPQNGAIFPSPEEIKADGLEIEFTTIENGRRGENKEPERIIIDPSMATATLFLPDSGFHVHYRFRRAAGCWFLFGISDRST